MNIMPRKSLKEVMAEVASRENCFIRKTLVYVSPLTNDLEYRVAYFTSAAESAVWEGELSKKYQELGITYECYTDYLEKGVNL